MTSAEINLNTYIVFLLNTHVLKQAKRSQLSSELNDSNDYNCCLKDMSSWDKDKNSLIQC